MADNSDILAQISALFEASQKSNSKSTQEATKLALKQLTNQLQIAQGNNKTSRQIASGNNQSAEQIASGNNQSAEQIASGNNQTSLQVASGNNQSSERIASGNNQTSLQIASGNNQTSLATNAANNETQRYVSNLENQTRLQLQEKEAVAAEQQQARELASKLGIVNLEQQQDIEARLTLGREQLGFSREQLAANMQVENAKLAQAHEEMVRVGIPAMLADKWYKEQQVVLAQSAQRIDQQNANTNEGRLGYDVFSKAVDMASTPAKRYQFGDLMSGLATNPNARDWMAKMSGAVNDSGFGPSSETGVMPITPQQALGDFMGMLGVPGAGPGTGQPAGVISLEGVRQFLTENPGYGVQNAVTYLTTPGNEVAAAGMIQRERQRMQTGQAPTSMPGVSQFLTENPGATLQDAVDWLTKPVNSAAAQAMAQREQARVGAATEGVAFAGGSPTFSESRQPVSLGSAASGMNPTGNAALDAFLAQRNAELGQIAKIADAGGSALTPGTLESMKPDDLAEFQSGMAKLRRDVPAWTRDYQTAGVYNAAPDKLAA
jgi:hypothetical protein